MQAQHGLVHSNSNLHPNYLSITNISDVITAVAADASLSGISGVDYANGKLFFNSDYRVNRIVEADYNISTHELNFNFSEAVKDPNGELYDPRSLDLEDISLTSDGLIIVSNEKIQYDYSDDIYKSDDALFLIDPNTLQITAEIKIPLPHNEPMGLNEGIEAFLIASDNNSANNLTVVAFEEGSNTEHTRIFKWHIENNNITAETVGYYHHAPEFHPVAIREFGPSHYILLERHSAKYSSPDTPGMFKTLVKILNKASVENALLYGSQDTAVEGKVIFGIEPFADCGENAPFNDNFEGMATIAIDDDNMRVILVSDDNILNAQHTYILELDINLAILNSL
jgi:hypothetical protein